MENEVIDQLGIALANSGTLVAKSHSISERLSLVDWQRIQQGLDDVGYAIIPRLLTTDECEETSDLYEQEQLHRSRVVMERYSFGQGEYRYFRYPLPDRIGELRTALYPRLAPIANRWHAAMRIDTRFPAAHAEFIERCRTSGQQRPTPLILRYYANDYCCLHQDLYGEHVFPMQVVILLAEPGRDFAGGEFMLTEQSPKYAPRAEIVPLKQGDAVIFAVNCRPVPSTRGYHRVTMRHGVSRLMEGKRTTLGIIFHDAK